MTETQVLIQEAHARSPWAFSGPVGPATWTFVALALAAVAAFWGTLGEMVRIWTSSSSYHHGLLVGPICAWLAIRLRGQTPAGSSAPFALLPLAIFALVWLIGRLAGASILAHLGFVGVLISGAVLAYGWRIARKAALILLTMTLLVPFGESALPALKFLTAHGARILLVFASINVSLEANVLVTPTGRYAVADGCAGLNFVLASVLIGAVIAEVLLKRPLLRLAFLAFAIAAAIVANILRVTAIVAVTTVSNGSIPLAADHLALSLAIHMVLILLLVDVGRSLRPGSKPAAVPQTSTTITEAAVTPYDFRPAAAAFGLIALASALFAVSDARIKSFSMWAGDAHPWPDQPFHLAHAER